MTPDPIFAEPWQAQAFALAVRLSQEGHFTWKEWTETLAAELAAAAARGETDVSTGALAKVDDGTRYYEHWLAALETIVKAKGMLDQRSLDTRKDAWADAYRHTPHGKPVELRRASQGPPYDNTARIVKE